MWCNVVYAVVSTLKKGMNLSQFIAVTEMKWMALVAFIGFVVFNALFGCGSFLSFLSGRHVAREWKPNIL